MPPLPRTKSQWVALKPIIYHLYISEHMTLHQVLEVLSRESEIRISPASLKRKIKEWGMRKNCTNEEMAHILHIVSKESPALISKRQSDKLLDFRVNVNGQSKNVRLSQIKRYRRRRYASRQSDYLGENPTIQRYVQGDTADSQSCLPLTPIGNDHVDWSGNPGSTDESSQVLPALQLAEPCHPLESSFYELDFSLGSHFSSSDWSFFGPKPAELDLPEPWFDTVPSLDCGSDGFIRRLRRTLGSPGVATDAACEHQQKFFACPYAASTNNRISPSRRVETKCSAIKLQTISSLMHHLFKVHVYPDHFCQRCFEVFLDASQLSSHKAKCDKPRKVNPFRDSMSPEENRLIRLLVSNRRPEEAWFAIFGVLFPTHPGPISPYAGNSSFASIDELLALLMQQLHGQLQLIFSEKLNTSMIMDGATKARLEEIHNSTILEAFSTLGSDCMRHSVHSDLHCPSTQKAVQLATSTPLHMGGLNFSHHAYSVLQSQADFDALIPGLEQPFEPLGCDAADALLLTQFSSWHPSSW
ncbi:uncharacterized protein A1O9_03138 [Exophiala aquamarina CBS 119918]|uniref:Clr5 domain-containing protein n=1 Tax=Exophiala aquamarina CBS 119918 TaxID=1182545 RepID=A0A072Q0Y9_9EURO|nr:uncharacterized protein A1O9_03138 [Exophiala aquamarina CBS 119918]KEF61570.1 hypothetical protein A1O9_03138 [Exophiala aquamarina CBS 119918]